MIFKKLKSKIGETISETLVSSLIAAMSMIIFASMSIAAMNIIAKNKITLENYYMDKSYINTNDESYHRGEARLEFSNALINSDTEYSTSLYSNSNNSEDTGMIIYSY